MPTNYLVDKPVSGFDSAHERLQFIHLIIALFIEVPVIGRTLRFVSIPELLPVLNQYVNQLMELIVVTPYSSS